MNENKLSQNKFANISNQELLEEYVQRLSRGEISKDDIILTLIRTK